MAGFKRFKSEDKRAEAIVLTLQRVIVTDRFDMKQLRQENRNLKVALVTSTALYLALAALMAKNINDLLED